MAAENEATCESDPNFAVICGFLEKFSGSCGLTNIDFLDLQQMLENTQEVPQELVELHVKLLRKARKSVSNERWEKAVIKLCYSFCKQDAWEIERFGYKKARISSKLRILKQLLEMQFDFNAKFKNEINKMSANELRSQPIGRDKLGCAYWYQSDDNCQVRVYKDDPDEETWTLVAKDREGVVSLISELQTGDSVKIGTEAVLNEDSSSIEIEKPILDTGQSDSPPKSEEDPKNENIEDDKNNLMKEEENANGELYNKEESDSNQSSDDDKQVMTSIEEENELGLDLSVKSSTNIKIKPLSQLLAPKIDEPCGITDKYMREDKIPTRLRMAVESAGFDISNTDLNQSEGEDSIEPPQPIKKLKLSRPTLLNNKVVCNENVDSEVTDEIEDPVIIVKAHGNGTDNYSPNTKLLNFNESSPIIGETIEEAVMYIVGEGNGFDCTTGNETNQKKENSEKLANANESSKQDNSIKDSDIDKKLEKDSSPSKVYKLGTIIDVKTDHKKIYTSSKKVSRWDVAKANETISLKEKNDTMTVQSNTGQVENLISEVKNITDEKPASSADSKIEEALVENEENDNIAIKVPEHTPKQSVFFFGPHSVGSTLAYSTHNKSEELIESSIISETDVLNEDRNQEEQIQIPELKSIDTTPVLNSNKNIIVDSSKDDLNTEMNTNNYTKSDHTEINDIKNHNMPSIIDNITSCDNKNVPCNKYENFENLPDDENNLVTKSETKVAKVNNDIILSKIEVLQDEGVLNKKELHADNQVNNTISSSTSKEEEEIVHTDCKKVQSNIDINEEASDISKDEEKSNPTTPPENKASIEISHITETVCGKESITSSPSEVVHTDMTTSSNTKVELNKNVDLEEIDLYAGKKEVVEEVIIKKYIAPLGVVSEVDQHTEKCEVKKPKRIKKPKLACNQSLKKGDDASEQSSRSILTNLLTKESAVDLSSPQIVNLAIINKDSISTNQNDNLASHSKDVTIDCKLPPISNEKTVEQPDQIFLQASGKDETCILNKLRPPNPEARTDKHKSERDGHTNTITCKDQQVELVEECLPKKAVSKIKTKDLSESNHNLDLKCNNSITLQTNSTDETCSKVQEDCNLKVDTKEQIITESSLKMSIKSCESTNVDNFEENAVDASIMSKIEKDVSVLQPKVEDEKISLSDKIESQSNCDDQTNEITKLKLPKNEKIDSTNEHSAKAQSASVVKTNSSKMQDILKELKSKAASKEKLTKNKKKEVIDDNLRSDENHQLKDDAKANVILLNSLSNPETIEIEPKLPLNEVSTLNEKGSAIVTEGIKDSPSEIVDTLPAVKESTVNLENENKVPILNEQIEQDKKIELKKDEVSEILKLDTENESTIKTDGIVSKDNNTPITEDVKINESEDSSKAANIEIQCIESSDDDYDNDVGVASIHSRSNSISDTDVPNPRENIEIKTVEDFEESIMNVQIRQNENNKNKNDVEIKTSEDFEDSIEVKKIKLSDAIAEKNAAAQNQTALPARRTRSSVKKLSTKEQSNELIEIKDDSNDAATTESTNKQPLTLANFQLDADFTPRVTRKRSHGTPEVLQSSVIDAKRSKTKGKRPVDNELRKSIEMKKSNEKSSSDDDVVEIVATIQESTKRPKSKKKGSKKKAKGKKSANISITENKNTDESLKKENEETQNENDDSTKEQNDDATKEDSETQKKSTPRKKSRLLLGLEIPLDSDISEPVTGVRQSRRIAQIKIKEEAERRKVEELALHEIEIKYKSKKDDDKDYKGEKKKKSKNIIIDDDSSQDVTSDEKKKHKKRKHKRVRKAFDETNPWRSSSDSSSSDEEEEEEIAEYSDEDEKLVFKSDHEFSPESDLEDNAEIQPLKRARTVKKESDVEIEVDDCNCQKCGKADHPEWILLCDGCDNGLHCSCLRPPLLVIPEGDWYCPPCQHAALIKNFEEKLIDFDKKLNKRELEVRRKERLAYVGISLDNVLPLAAKEEKKIKTKEDESSSESDADGSDSDSSSSSYSSNDSDEPIYQLRQRRQAHSYRFNDYDDLINSAIQDEMETVKPTVYQSRGKDISTIINADKEEPDAVIEETPTETETLPPVVPKEVESLPPVTPEKQESDEEIKPVRKNFRAKKHRKLNSLDISSEDDAESDEDFKGNSSDEEEDEFDDEFGSESSDFGRRHKDAPIRRSTRARTSRYDKDFINDDDSDDAPRKKKTRSIWDESESEESDRSWGRRKRKSSKRPRVVSSPKQKKRSKKKKRNKDDSDVDVYRKRKPKIKYGGLSEEETTGRRTRGKKITYVDALGSDSDEETLRKPPPRINDSEEEEFVLNEDEDLENEKDSDDAYEEESEEDDERYRNEMKQTQPKIQPQLPNPNETASNFIMTPQMQENNPNLPIITQNVMAPLNLPVDANQDFDEPNPIDQINKNVEEMDMEMMIEDEEYANKQLQLVAVQIEKERKRKEKEALKLEQQFVPEPKIPKKRGRKPKNYDANAGMVITQSNPPIPTDVTIGTNMINTSLPINTGNLPNNDADTPRKRRGRGKGKKTLAAEAAAAAASTVVNISNDSSSQSMENIPITNTQEVLQSGKLGIATPPQPFSQAQPTPSVITRMLQSQQNPANFPPNNPNIGPKFYGPPDSPSSASATITTGSPSTPGAFAGNLGTPRGVNVQYRPPTANLNYMPRGIQPNVTVPQGMPPHLYHPHPIEQPVGAATGNVPGRSSPSTVPPAGSPLSTKNSVTPPPPPYSRSQILRFPPPNNASPINSPSTLSSRSMAMGHMSSPRGRLSPHQPGLPANYHFPTFPPNMNEDGITPSASSYCNTYEQFPTEPPSDNKLYEEDSEGEFGGLVSYFSSQREDDLDT